jgi:hypothetical protein
MSDTNKLLKFLRTDLRAKADPTPRDGARDLSALIVRHWPRQAMAHPWSAGGS